MFFTNLRDGQQITLAARDLVPGDIVLLEAGNYVPADLRLVSAVNLKIEEAALTGESVPVEKHAALVVEPDAALGDRKNCAFLSTLITYGRGKGVVTGVSPVVVTVVPPRLSGSLKYALTAVSNSVPVPLTEKAARL